MKALKLLCTAALAVFTLSLNAQEILINYEESKIEPYSLPDPLVFNSGKKVRNAKAWTDKRRAEVLEIFSREMYGHVPERPEGLHFRPMSTSEVYGGMGIRKTVRIFLDEAEQHWFDVLIHLPAGTEGPVPVFIGLNFKGNDATLDEREGSRWPYELILKAGYGVATAWRDAVEPDGERSGAFSAEGICKDGGVRAWYNTGGDWGAISAWAWGVSRIADYIETDPAFDSGRMSVLGHSRLGKTALWAGANDTRFGIVISNDSGCCGAAISRRVFGENFNRIATTFPYWFTDEFLKYKEHESDFPADQHWLAALAAPRPLYIASASEDLWADPKGEWLCAQSVAPVYALFGMKGVGETMPDPDGADNSGSVGYHLRKGPHNITAFDWSHYIDFANRHYAK